MTTSKISRLLVGILGAAPPSAPVPVPGLPQPASNKPVMAVAVMPATILHGLKRPSWSRGEPLSPGGRHHRRSGDRRE